MKSTKPTTLKSRKSIARDLGAAAFASGATRFPYSDPALKAMMHRDSLRDAKLARENIAIGMEWIRGWDGAMLATPVPSAE